MTQTVTTQEDIAMQDILTTQINVQTYEESVTLQENSLSFVTMTQDSITELDISGQGIL